MSITNSMEKIKQFIASDKGKDILIVIIVILVGIASFELGRLSKESSSGDLKIINTQTGEYPSQDQGVSVILSQNSNSTGKTFFASNKGSKYYSLGCSAGKTIKQENRIYFTTGEEAQAAGYTLSSSCN